MNKTLRILHVITGLGRGGAEMMLLKVLSRATTAPLRHEVVCLSDITTLAPDLQRLGITVHVLGMPPGRLTWAGLRGLHAILRAAAPDVIQGWMYHANVISTLAAPVAAPRARVMWSVHCTLSGSAEERWVTRALIRASGWLAGRVRAIHHVSAASAADHARIGYPARTARVVPIGFDTTLFAPDAQRYRAFRVAHGLRPDTRIIGHVARLHPVKDHQTFFRACHLLASDSAADLAFVVIGKDVDRAHFPDLDARFILLGERADIPALLPAFDVSCLSSAYGESFPNVLGEAMACAVPCVATALGDCATIIGDTGRIVAPRDAPAMARALAEVLAARTLLGPRARARIEGRYSIDSMAAGMSDLWLGDAR